MIWKGDEIILKKKLIKVPKKGVEPEKSLEVSILQPGYYCSLDHRCLC